MRRIRQLGLFQGLELEAEELEQLPQLPNGWPFFTSELSRTPHPWAQQTPAPGDPCFDPLSDPLDEPFPEELE